MLRGPTTVWGVRAGLLVALGLALLGSGSAGAQTLLNSVSSSPDVTLDLSASGGDRIDDENVALDDLGASVAPVLLGALPEASDVSAYARLANGDQRLCFANVEELPGPVRVARGDVVRFDGASYAIEFDASANGVPEGAACDAVEDGTQVVLSFDVAVELPGGVVAHDEDLVRVDGPGSFTLVFDGSAAGVPRELDVDGAHLLSNGHRAVSFDVAGTVGGVRFDDEDVLEYDPGTASWSLAFDASARDPSWADVDVDAVELARECVGDIDGDGATGGSDFGIFATNFGMMVPPGTGGDFTGDGVVGGPDYEIFGPDFGCTP